MPELVTIPIANFEITVEYQSPSIRLWVHRAQGTIVLEKIFEAFTPSGLTIDDIDGIEQGKNSEKGVRFRFPRKRASFFFSGSLCKVTQENADWATADESLKMLNAGFFTLAETRPAWCQRPGNRKPPVPPRSRCRLILHRIT